MTKRDFLEYLHAGDFRQLFLECFWNNPTTTVPSRITIGGADAAGSAAGQQEYLFSEAAQKGMKVYVCKVERIPDSSVRRQLDTRLRKLSNDYISIYVSTSEPFHHLWSVPVKTVDKRQLVSVEYDKDDQAAFLLGKMDAITFPMDTDVTIIDVVDKVNAAFLVNTTDVTKKFYQSFKKHHDLFVKGIENIEGEGDREWYASVMLNRLMFCYFIQKKRFLNFDENYLANKLKETQEKKGADKFYGSFYRSFLKQLFSDGLDKPHKERSEYFTRKYGRIPYLNGGMFSMHQIENENKDIDIPDKVFEQLFAFFDEWHWHLDNRITASGRDINPDVLGYIFEQYINDRAQMGAYYTKEDITEYIGRNTIIPWIWIKAMGTADVVWGRAGAPRTPSPIDRYIFPAMRKGIDLALPPEIEKGVAVEPQATIRARRVEWNKPASEEYALPTEIWRETVARRQRCAEIREKFEKGDIKDIHDFITYNLDIRTFAEDVIRNTSDHKLVAAFYGAIREVTILDPTCGSGAFLFAALNILEPLYEACIDRMEEFHANDANLFKDEIAEITGKFRSNRQYFVYKSIILRNLYGVDIMPEATEIARLRLFLKMVAVVDVDEMDDNLGLDPLPDIDFNIRCGNTLVGYATDKEIEDGLVNGDMFAYAELKGKIDAELGKASMAFDFFRREQLNLTGDRQQLVSAKEEIHKRLAVIRKLLDDHLYASSGRLKKNDVWLRDTQPFHWYTEFYPIMHGRGGFDVIIGNPPYVEYSKVKDYKIQGYKTESCGNLYAFVIERAESLISSKGSRGMIIPHSAICTDRMRTLFDILMNAKGWFSTYDIRPAKLFDGVDQRLLIYLLGGEEIYSTNYRRWNEEARLSLFNSIRYTKGVLTDYVSLGKFQSEIERSIYRKVCNAPRLQSFTIGGNKLLYYHNAPRYFLRFSDQPPYFYSDKQGEVISAHIKSLKVAKRFSTVAAALNSSLFYLWFISFSNCRDLVLREIESFHIPDMDVPNEVIKRLFTDYKRNSRRKETFYKATGRVVYDEYYPKLSKPIIDEIDELLAKHYGFTEEELDFIINYDIKYRMGDELNAGE